MSSLRDARLQKALDCAPDTQLLPSDASRKAIFAAAHAAVAPATIPAARRVPWWQRAWASAGERRGPWNAAFASVLLASLVTVLWVDREIPGARPEGSAGQEAIVPAPAPAAPAVPAVSPVAPAPAPAAPAVRAPAERPAQADTAQRKAEARLQAETQRAQQSRKERREDAPQPPAALPPPPARLPPPEARAEAPFQAEAARDSAAPQAPMAAPPVAAAARAPAPAPGLSLRMPLAGGWTGLRILMDGRGISLDREQAGSLAGPLDGVLTAVRGSAPLTSPVLVRIEILRDGEVLGLLELSAPDVRWTPVGGTALTGRPTPASLQALREGLDRLAGQR